MPLHFCISIRFLDGLFHGRRDGGEPEWPPSPLRIFQTLVAAAAAYTNERDSLKTARASLLWLEAMPTPEIITPPVELGAKYRLYVPDNVADKVARSWRSGNEASIADYRSEKDVQPLRLTGGDTVHYIWSLAEGDSGFQESQRTLENCVKAITHLGWGIDLVVAHASTMSEKEVSELTGQRWHPIEGQSRNVLRVPTSGTLDDLNRRFSAFLRRTTAELLVPVPPLSKFRWNSYLSGFEQPAAALASFELKKLDGGFRPFDPVRNGMRVAGMLRHAASDQSVVHALGWSEEKIRGLILGHGEQKGATHLPVEGPRLAFIPLPSIEIRGRNRSEVIGSARRVLLMGVRGANQNDLQQLARLISGQPLVEEHTGNRVAVLSGLPESDPMVNRYLRSATSWATVTPVVLPGYDDPSKCRQKLSKNRTKTIDAEQQKRIIEKLDRRIEFLIRKAIRQAGFSSEIAERAIINWNNVGFWPGTDLASRYAVPATLRPYRKLHVKISWRDAHANPLQIGGPICIGSGRFVGMGLFAPLG